MRGLGRACLLIVAAAWPARAAEEAALLELWKQHLAKSDDHPAALAACAAFVSANGNDPLVPVVRGWQEWHQLRAGQKAETATMLEQDAKAPAGAVTDSARFLAQGWLTRLDRERVAEALQIYYRQEIAYPKTLESFWAWPKLPAAARPPNTDRFGKPWTYGLTGFAKVKGFTNQKYTLQSSTLGDLSDLQTTLAVPYGSRVQAVPAEVLAAPNNTVTVRFKLSGGRAAALAPGQAAGELHLAFVGAQIVVFCDATHWKVAPRP